MATSSRILMRLTGGLLTVEVLLSAATACHISPASQAPSPAPAYELERHFPGVVLSRSPRGGVLIRVVSGLVGRKPLYVIDGTPLEVDPRRGIDWLTPEEIQRVEVLKRPGETVIYGPRGAYGVIVITTKRNVTPKRQ